jgi:hypothetical protein
MGRGVIQDQDVKVLWFSHEQALHMGPKFLMAFAVMDRLESLAGRRF